MALLHRVIVGLKLVETVVIVADEIIAEADNTTVSEAAITERGMVVINLHRNVSVRWIIFAILREE